MKIKPRPALYFLIPFLLGIIIGKWTSIPILWLWLSVLILIISSLLIKSRSKYLCFILLHISIFTCGMLRLEIATVPSIPDHFYDQPVSFVGKTVYQPERGESWEACYAVGKIQLLADYKQTANAKLLIRFQEVHPLRYGKQILLTGVLRQADSQRNPGGFDYRAYLARKNISGIVHQYGRFSIGTQSGFYPLRWIEALRLKTEQIIDTAYSNLQTETTDSPSLHAKLLKGILLGKRSDVPSATLDIFRNSGTFHVLAVSGLHVGLIATFCFLGLSSIRFSTFHIDEKVICLFTILVVVLYACLVGFRPSVFRASLMAILYLLAKIINRDVDIFNLLAVAALFLLLINPMQVWDVGFQLSFVAVASIVFFVPKPLRSLWDVSESGSISRYMRYKNLAIKWLVLSYLVTFAAQLGTGPLIAFHFFRIYPLGTIVGPFAVGLISLIVGVGIISVCVGYIWIPPAKMLAQVNHIIISIFLKIIGIFGQEWGIMKIASPTFGIIVIYIVICLGIIHWRFLYKQWKVASLIGLTVVAIWIWDNAYHEKGRLLEVVTLDVGQGDAAIIRFPDRQTMIVDGGIQRSYNDEKRKRTVEYDVGERIIEPFLNVNNIKQLDLVVLTHPDIDHGGGLAYILQNYKVDRIIGITDMQLDSQTHQRLRSIAKTRDIPYAFPYVGDIKLTSTTSIQLLHPIDSESTNLIDKDKNDDSLVLKISYGEVDILFTGDIEFKAENRILASQQNLRSDILKVPHHGSRTSSSTQFLDAVQPRYAIFSLGKSNRFQFPHEDVVERYHAINCVQLRTDQLGAITLKTDGTRCWFGYTVLPHDF